MKTTVAPFAPSTSTAWRKRLAQVAVEGGLADVLPLAPDLLVEGLAARRVEDDVGVVGVDPAAPGGEEGVRVACCRRARPAPPRRPRP